MTETLSWDVTDKTTETALLLSIQKDYVYFANKESGEEEGYPLQEVTVQEGTEGPMMQRKQIFISSSHFTLKDLEFASPEESDHFYLVSLSIMSGAPPTQHIEADSAQPGTFTRLFHGFKAGFGGAKLKRKESKPLLDIEGALSIEDITKNLGRKVFTMPDGPFYTLFDTSSTLNDNRLKSSKGETGCIPVLSRIYKICLHRNLVPVFPTSATPQIVSETWSRMCYDMWGWFAETQSSPVVPKGVFSFSWRGYAADGSVLSTTKTSHIPIDFTMNDKCVWIMSKGVRTPGTCFRKAKQIHPDSAWLANSICNFYKVNTHINKGKEDKMMNFNIYRHGIVGYLEKSLIQANFLIPQLTLVLTDALIAQKNMYLPFRIVSHNLVNQTKVLGTLNNEKRMMDRQAYAFSIALQMAAQQGICHQSNPPSISQFFLPGNTDKSVLLAIEDSIPGINDPGSLQYLLWVCEDFCDVCSKIVLNNEDYVEYERDLPAGDSHTRDCRWQNEEHCFLVNISLISLLHDISLQVPMDGEYLSQFMNHSNSKIWKTFLPYLLMEIKGRVQAHFEGTVEEGNNSHAFIRTMLAILSGLGFAIFSSLIKLDENELQEDSGQYKNVLHDIQRCRISVNLLRAALLSEVFKRNEFQEKKEWEGFRSMGRVFSRTTSLLCIALLDYCLGACVFVNCKSGLDRTGIFTALQSAVVSLWEHYPENRWELHLTCINFNLIRKIAKLDQPRPEQEDKILSFLTSLNCTSSKQETKIEDNFDTEKQGRVDIEFGVTKIVFDRAVLATFAIPMFFLIKNYSFSYLVDANSLITYASTGLRGMKYHNHVLVGLLMPRAILFKNKKHSIIRKAASLSGGLVAEFLTELGDSLLVDLSAHRKS